MLNDHDAQFLKDAGAVTGAAAVRRLQTLYWKVDDGTGNGGPYPKQVEYHHAGKENRERSILGGNRTGKSRTRSAETAMHLTGLYPPWWTGRRFDHPVNWWVGGKTNESTRDICQAELLGPPSRSEALGTGWIPKDRIHPNGYSVRQCGVKNVAEMVAVRHESGGWSQLGFKSYEQGREKWQGVSLDGLDLDEEAPDELFQEGRTRVLDRRGLICCCFTPLLGMTEMTRYLIQGRGGHRPWFIHFTWDDSPHLDEQAKAVLMATYPEHELAARTRGEFIIGTGAVFPIDDTQISCDPFDPPGYYRRVCGVDFGIDHPFAAAWLAHDPETDVVYVHDAQRMKGASASDHAVMLNTRQPPWVPKAWPHDGAQRDKGSGVPLAQTYEQIGVEMLPGPARNSEEAAGAHAVEPGLHLMLHRMRTGRLKVFRTLGDWFAEKRMYHRKDGKVVKLDDDLMSATRYGLLCLDQAVTELESGNALGGDVLTPQRGGVQYGEKNRWGYDPLNQLRRRRF